MASVPSVAKSGYVTKEMPDVCRTSDVSFRPIDVKLGPDGALYVADWSNPVINHGEVDFRDPRRDHVHGRIWRKTIEKNQLDAYSAAHHIIANRLFGGRTVIHVLADRDPGDGFAPAEGTLEDAYFSTLFSGRRAG